MVPRSKCRELNKDSCWLGLWKTSRPNYTGLDQAFQTRSWSWGKFASPAQATHNQESITEKNIMLTQSDLVKL